MSLKENIAQRQNLEAIAKIAHAVDPNLKITTEENMVIIDAGPGTGAAHNGLFEAEAGMAGVLRQLDIQSKTYDTQVHVNLQQPKIAQKLNDPKAVPLALATRTKYLADLQQLSLEQNKIFVRALAEQLNLNIAISGERGGGMALEA